MSLESRWAHVNVKFHFYRPRSEGDNALGSVRPSVCLSVCALTAEPSAAKSIRSDYQSKCKDFEYVGNYWTIPKAALIIFSQLNEDWLYKSYYL